MVNSKYGQDDRDKLRTVKLRIASPSAQMPQGERTELDFDINLFGQTLNCTISVDNHRARLTDLVPPARTLCTEVINATVKAMSDRGFGITCTKGCSHCCNYLISVSSAEAFAIAEEISAMPAFKRSALFRSAIAAAKHVLDRSATIQYLDPLRLDSFDNNVLLRISKWYADLNLMCPFQANNTCMIYDIRPLACREHLVSCAASVCKFGSPGMPHVVTLPVNIANVLMRTGAKLQNIASEAILLPLIAPYAETNTTLRTRTWPTRLMAEIFIDALQTEMGDFYAKHTTTTSSYSHRRPLDNALYRGRIASVCAGDTQRTERGPTMVSNLHEP